MKNAHTVLCGLRKQDMNIDHIHIDIPLQVLYHRTSQALDLTRLTGCNRVRLDCRVAGGVK